MEKEVNVLSAVLAAEAGSTCAAGEVWGEGVWARKEMDFGSFVVQSVPGVQVKHHPEQISGFVGLGKHSEIIWNKLQEVLSENKFYASAAVVLSV